MGPLVGERESILEVECYMKREEDGWYACCHRYNIESAHPDSNQARQNLASMIKSYVSFALSRKKIHHGTHTIEDTDAQREQSESFQNEYREACSNPTKDLFAFKGKVVFAITPEFKCLEVRLDE